MRALLFPLLLLTAPAAAQQADTGAARGGRAFVPADWYRVTTVSTPAISPDGQRVAFTVTTVNEKENKRHSEVWLADVAGGAPVRLTDPTNESSAPRWTPDGTRLLFTSSRPGSKVRTWALRMDRPGGEAFEADSIREGSWPADRRFVAWADTVEGPARDTAAAPKDPWEKMPAMARPPHGAITQPLDAARFDGRHVIDFPYKSNGTGFVPGRREARAWRARQLWRQDAGGARRQLTDGAYSHFDVTVSPDGKWIAFTADPALRPDSVVQAERDSLGRLRFDARREERRNERDIFLVAAEGGAPRRLTTQDGSEGGLAWSPDGRELAFVNRQARSGPERLYVVGTEGGAPRELLGDWPYEPDRCDWLAGGAIACGVAIGGRTAFVTIDPRTRRRTEVLGGRRRLSGFSTSPDGRTVAYVATSLTRPTELHVASLPGGEERQLTRFNDRLNAEVAWADGERFTYPSVGGLEIEAWLMRPHGYVEGRRYPLVLYIHGGPHSAYGENWFDEFQNLAGAGMWVLFTNPRGSSGYGAAFTYATRGRWGEEDYQDLMKAVDLAIRRPGVDSTRLGVTGGSYGGFMTAWITAKTSRFRAAQADRMISNWWSWYGSSDAQGLTEYEFLGKPWENPALYDRYAPIRFVDRVTTPTLIVQSEEDHRTPMTDAEQWFMALRKRGIPAEFVRYPRSNHDLSRTGEPWLLVDRLGRLRQWFGHWLGR